ncbi:hypothetical protein AADZ86_16720 [Colwelliaceae bacterium BS250]
MILDNFNADKLKGRIGEELVKLAYCTGSTYSNCQDVTNDAIYQKEGIDFIVCDHEGKSSSVEVKSIFTQCSDLSFENWSNVDNCKVGNIFTSKADYWVYVCFQRGMMITVLRSEMLSFFTFCISQKLLSAPKSSYTATTYGQYESTCYSMALTLLLANKACFSEFEESPLPDITNLEHELYQKAVQLKYGKKGFNEPNTGFVSPRFSNVAQDYLQKRGSFAAQWSDYQQVGYQQQKSSDLKASE